MNNKHRPRVLALSTAALASLGLCVGAYAQTATQQAGQDRQVGQDRLQTDQPGQQAQAPQLPPGIERSADAPDTDGVQELLRNISSAALTEDGFDSVTRRLVGHDRDRWDEWLGGWLEANDFSELNQAAERFRVAYEHKYGQEFEMADGQVVFPRLLVVQGEVRNQQQAAMNWPVNPTGREGGADQAQVAGGIVDETRQHEIERERARQGQPAEVHADHLDEGRDVAIARVIGVEDRQPLTVSLVREFPGFWRVDLPNHIRAEQTYQRLTQRINELAQQPDQWPADARDTQQLIAYEVLSILYGVDQQQGLDRDAMHRDGVQRDGIQRQEGRGAGGY